MSENTAELRQVLEKLFDQKTQPKCVSDSPDVYSQKRFDFAFHLNDAKNDIASLAQWLQRPEVINERDTMVWLSGILLHIVPHLNAAARILMGSIPDPFASNDNLSKQPGGTAGLPSSADGGAMA